VIPAYGRVEETQELVTSLQREPGDPVVYVVDNGGDYTAVGPEVVLRPESNLGWLRGTNLGTVRALEAGAEAVIWMNNDVCLSPAFVRELTGALRDGVGVVAPCYDDHMATQRRGYDGPAADYATIAREHEVSVVDGTCVLVTAGALAGLGLLDEARFGLFGWGAIDDFCLRARRAGYAVLVTERAYLQHAQGSTVDRVHGVYEHVARAEMWIGMRRKHGRGWPTEFPDLPYTRDGRAWYVTDRLHLWLWKRGRRVSAPSAG
jgi:GT2 family glycosyltransferase